VLGATVVAGVVLLLATGAREALRARQAEKEQARLSAAFEAARIQLAPAIQRAEAAVSVSEALQAEGLLGKNQVTAAAAHLVRSLAANSNNVAALTRLLYLLTYRSWPKELLKLPTKANCADITADGNCVLGVGGSSARIWSAKTGKILAEFSTIDSEPWLAGFSPDGSRVLTADFLQLWNAKTGKPIGEAFDQAISVPPFEPGAPRRSAALPAFSPDGWSFLTFGLVDCTTGKLLNDELGMGTILRKELRLELSLSQILQILSVNAFEQVSLAELVAKTASQNETLASRNQLMLWH